MRASDAMTSPAVTIREDVSLEAAARLMLEQHVGGLPVTGPDGRLVGFITDSDFSAKEVGIPFSLVTAPKVLGEWIGHDGIERLYARARSLRVRDVMTSPAIVVPPDEPIESVMRAMLDHDVNRIVVAEAGKPLGVVARHDLLRVFLNQVAA